MSPTNVELVAIGLAAAVTYGSITNHLASRIATFFRGGHPRAARAK